MRSNTLLIIVVVVVLFVVSIIAGYVLGEKYLKQGAGPAPAVPGSPAGRQTPTAPRPGDVAPPTVPPGASGLVTPRLAPRSPATPAPMTVPAPAAMESPGPAATPGQAPPPAPQTPASLPAGPSAEPAPDGGLFIVQVGAFASRENADGLVDRLRADGFSPYVVRDGNLLKVRVGAFRDRALADALVARLRAKGYSVAVVR